MIEELVKETVSILEKSFYDKKFYFSYSSINKLLYSPAVFYQIYILNQRPEGKERHLIEGRVIHCLLLEPLEFDKRYIVSPTNLPKDNAKFIIDVVYSKNLRAIREDPSLELDNFEYTILETLASIPLHQSLKTDEQRMEKVITEQNKSYFEFLKQKDNKELLDQETFAYCQAAVEIIKDTPGVEKLLGLNVQPHENIEVFNELYIEMDMPGEKFGLKGYVDNIVINHDEKIIYVNDFKSTAKELDKFEESVEFWGYWLQAAIYVGLVGTKWEKLFKEKGYTMKFCFLVCDKYLSVYPFEVTDKTINIWLKRLIKVIEENVKYHYYHNRYELPAKYDQRLVKL